MMAGETPGPEPQDGVSPDDAPLSRPTTSAERWDLLRAWLPVGSVAIVAAVLAVLATLYVLPRIGQLASWILVAFFLSLALEPAVNWAAAHGWRRGVATGVVLFGTAAIGVLLVVLIVPSVVRGIVQLADDLPELLADANRFTERIGIDLTTPESANAVANLQDAVQSLAGDVLQGAIDLGVAIVGGLFGLATVGMFLFYFVADGPRFRRVVCSFLPTETQRRVLTDWEIAIDKTGGYFYSRLLLATLSAAGTFIVLRILDQPFAAPMAVFVGLVSQFIPTIGTYIAMIVPIVLALLVDPPDAWILLIYFTAYQQLENLVLSPKISAKTMTLHPAVAFGAVLLGGAVLGAIGAFVALPVAATVQAIVSLELKRHRVVESELTQEGSVGSPSRLTRLRKWWEEARKEDA